MVAQSQQQGFGKAQLVLPQGAGIPLFGFHVINGDEGRLSPHGQTHIVELEFLVDRLAQGQRQTAGGDRLRAPLFLTLWYGGLLAGYLMGPARSSGTRQSSAGKPEAGKET